MDTRFLWFGLLGLLVSATLLHAGDWRQSGTEAQKLERLVAALPGTSHWMFEMGERYKNLYWAARLNKWEFADYQLEEIESLVRIVQITRPQRSATAQQFLDEAIAPMQESLHSRQWSRFKAGFQRLSQACMRCHVQNDHAFITLPEEPETAGSPVLNLARDRD